MRLIRPFGPSIFKVKIPEEIVDTLNNYIDDVANEPKKLDQLNYGEQLVGDVTQEFTLEKKIMQDSGWGQFLANCTSKWVEMEMGKKITKFQIANSWVVRQYKNEYNPTHWHGGHISGAGFLKLPQSFGKHIQDKQSKEYRGGNLQLIHGARMFSCHSTMNIIPEVGDFYFFPNYLMHSVFPFRGSDEERRSISFNAFIDNDIYNVYGKA